MSQRTVEEYVESIGALEETGSPASTSSIAQLLGVSLASVSEMLRRLSEKGLVEAACVIDLFANLCTLAKGFRLGKRNF